MLYAIQNNVCEKNTKKTETVYSKYSCMNSCRYNNLYFVPYFYFDELIHEL